MQKTPCKVVGFFLFTLNYPANFDPFQLGLTKGRLMLPHANWKLSTSTSSVIAFMYQNHPKHFTVDIFNL